MNEQLASNPSTVFETSSPPTVFNKRKVRDTVPSEPKWHGGTTIPDIPRDLTGQILSHETVARVQSMGVSATDQIARDSIVPPVFIPRTSWRARARFVALQEWEGTVLDIGVDEFRARLVNLSKDAPDMEADFPLDDVPRGDWDLLAPGAIFYWRVGYTDQSDGQRMRDSIIRFRRMPLWRKEDVEAARKEAEGLRTLFDRE